ncbi:uncharacterized protein DS421_19g639350 [Arachis hypogaea]|uniref:Uncharacterized protein n=1 Tax=Arachis hypogaea TaxID=3818 RepID=A0A6B9V5F7_ARAHY|nr:uncharacterized protein DS421_19g639350 [Arachis hypogaea]
MPNFKNHGCRRRTRCKLIFNKQFHNKFAECINNFRSRFLIPHPNKTASEISSCRNKFNQFEHTNNPNFNSAIRFPDSGTSLPVCRNATFECRWSSVAGNKSGRGRSSSRSDNR